jgi:hypothetical protein
MAVIFLVYPKIPLKYPAQFETVTPCKGHRLSVLNEKKYGEEKK